MDPLLGRTVLKKHAFAATLFDDPEDGDINDEDDDEYDVCGRAQQEEPVECYAF